MKTKYRASKTVRFFITLFTVCTLLPLSLFAASQRAEVPTIPVGISVELSMPNSTFASNDKLIVTVSFKNTTKDRVRFLKWYTPFEDQIKYDLFDVYFQGERLHYRGPMVRRAPPSNEDFISLAPSESITASVNLESAYAILESGEYLIRYRNNTLALSNAPFAKFVVYEARVRAPQNRQAANFTGCSASQMEVLNADVTAAEPRAKLSYEDLKNAPVEKRATAQRYLRWFGTYTPVRYQEVLDTMQKTYFALRDHSIGFECNSSCTDLASVLSNDHYNIRICPPYFNQPEFSTTAAPDGSRVGTLIHEITHFTIVGDTFDHAYFTTASTALAQNDPAKAVENADNYYFFFENVFPSALPMPVETPDAAIFLPPVYMLLLE